MAPLLELTPRERDLLKYISRGYPASYIAKKLELSVRTTENYIATIKEKLSCPSKVELIEMAQSFEAVSRCDFPESL